LAINNYIDGNGKVTANYPMSWDFSGNLQPEIYEPVLKTTLWSLEGNKKKYLSARDCDSKNYEFVDEPNGLNTQFSIIGSVVDPTHVFHIQSIGNFYNCPNSFLHY
jgi:hypothetical protein